MKLREFNYTREDGAKKTYSLLVLKEDTTSLEGISLRDLKEEDREKVIAIYKEFEEKLNPYMKNYRKFLKAKITFEEGSN